MPPRCAAAATSLLLAIVICAVILLVALVVMSVMAIDAIPPVRPHHHHRPPAAPGPSEPSAPSAAALPPTSGLGPSTAPTADDGDPLGEPLRLDGDRVALQVLHKRFFTIGFDLRSKEPAWVSYHLAGPIRFTGHEHRPPAFAPDPDLSDPPLQEDYTRSGYDRGHMCPAYAMFSRWGVPGLESTFITSNIIPQRHRLNAGRWEDAESLIAGRAGAGDGWAGRWGEVWVTDGPVLAAHPDRLRGGEAVPSACYMIVLRRARTGEAGGAAGWQALALEMPNAAPSEAVAHFLVAIASIEQQTGWRFFPALSAADHAALAAAPAPCLWP